MYDKQENMRKRLNQSLFGLVILLITGGTIFYHFVEKWSYLNSYYFSVVSLATVGYGDFVPKTDIGKVFTTFYILAGIGIIVAFTSNLVKRVAQRRANTIESKIDKSK